DESVFMEVLESLYELFLNFIKKSKRLNFYRAFYLAFHCVGSFAFKYFVNKILKEIVFEKFYKKFLRKNSSIFNDFVRNSLFFRVEHCSFILKEDMTSLLSFLEEKKMFGKVFLVINPEHTNFSLVDLYRYRDYFFICYASDSPIFELNLKESIFEFLGIKNNKYIFDIVEDIFKFNEILFNVRISI
ncbi:MAG: hypothetical protein ACK4ZM_03505, partial [bacterium]